MDSDLTLARLRAVVGDAHLHEDLAPAPGSGALEWCGRAMALVSPQDAAEIAEIVRIAEETGVGIVPTGGGTRLQTGYPPADDRPFLLLSTLRMNQVLDYQPDDLTVTVQPGITLEAVNQRLAERGQLLALDVPLPDRSTIGGIISTNSSQFWRPLYGSPRDNLIGVRAVIGRGVEVKGGGRVVKNVAGYDVCKLFSGAWGTVGIVTEATFKVRPLPEAAQVLVWRAASLEAAARAGLAMHRAPIAAAYTLATNEREGGEPTLVAGVRGGSAAVEWQVSKLKTIAATLGLTGQSTVEPESWIDPLRDAQARLGEDVAAAIRIACLPTEVADVVAEAHQDRRMRITAHCANGIVAVAATNGDRTAVTHLEELRPPGAGITWARAPEHPSAGLPVWGEHPGGLDLNRRLKETLDPTGVFSPGRWLGRI